MGVILDSSWMKFGPAERDSLEWSPGPPALLSTDRLPEQNSPGESRLGTLSVIYVVTATVSFILLVVGIVGLLAWRRRGAGGQSGGKLLANVIALDDLQDLQDLQDLRDPEVLEVLEVMEDLRDPERSRELLSSLRRSSSRRWRPSSSVSSEEQDPTADGVFLMVYLPSPYQHTLTRLARAASTRSSRRSLGTPRDPEGSLDTSKDLDTPRDLQTPRDLETPRADLETPRGDPETPRILETPIDLETPSVLETSKDLQTPRDLETPSRDLQVSGGP
ncbi:unnamed protein product [Merluccius merluccius]